MNDRISFADAPEEAITSKVFQNAMHNWTWQVKLPGGGSIHANRTFVYEWEARDDADRAIRSWLMDRIRVNRDAEAERIKAIEAKYTCPNSERIAEKTHSVEWFTGKSCQWCGVSRFEEAA